ncbi:MAG: asparagine synthase (glutamine-hydrolyzing) [Patescibacteria group bacterium]|nr:asparagine synthase (glutamine-hydrolyzing) [Patescibacteria group bacterium]
MCGICGKLNFNGQNADKNEILAMNKKLAHRGPDDEGVFLDGPIGLGHRRLSIIDLSSAGHQPMSDPGGRFWITYSGEIYNFKEIKKAYERRGQRFQTKTDTEIILHLYKIYGPSCLKHLNGMFAFAIWDKEKKELFLARDPIGKKPIKYYSGKNRFIFASELKAILTDPAVTKEPDWNAIDEFLTFKYIHAPRTGFKNIYKLPPAHYMLVKASGEITMEKYWGLDFGIKEEKNENQWKEEAKNKLIRAVDLRLVSDVAVGAHLSGGIDSGLITAIMAKELGQKVKTFSIGFEGYSEFHYAKLIAKQYHADHHEFTVKPDALEVLPKLAYYYEEPYADASAIPSWYLSKQTKNYATVALNGDGGDENFAGYERFIAMKIHKFLNKLPFKNLALSLNQKLSSALSFKKFNDISRLLSAYSPAIFDYYINLIAYFTEEQKNAILNPQIKNLIGQADAGKLIKKYFAKTEELPLLDRLLYAGINTYLPDDLIYKVEIASMAHGLEARSPFLDQHFLKFTAQMPTELKLKGWNKKYLLKKIAEEYLPRECVYRKKQGFTVPLDYWFRGRLNDYLRDNLLDKNFIDYGFNRAEIEKMISKHKSKQANYQNQLYALLMLRLWLKQWF